MNAKRQVLRQSVSRRKLRGAGISAVAFLLAAASIGLLWIVTMTGNAMDLAEWFLWPFRYWGVALVLVSFALGAFGVIVTWSDFACRRGMDLSRLVQWLESRDRRSKWITAISVIGLLLIGTGVSLSLLADAKSAAIGCLVVAVAAALHSGITIFLYRFLLRELRRIESDASVCGHR